MSSMRASRVYDNAQNFRMLGPNNRQLKTNDYVGFDKLPNQVVNLYARTGFNFNILVVGETGVGKSSLIRSLFENDYELKPMTNQSPESREMTLKNTSYDLCEANVNLKLKITETVGYSDQLNRHSSTNYLFQYIEEQMLAYATEELKSDRVRQQIRDNRIHLCLFVISPVGTGLRPFEIMTMQRICRVVNLVPVIAKADIFTTEELESFKIKTMEAIVANNICLYAPPIDDPASKERNKNIIKKYPLAVINANENPPTGGRYRTTPIGRIDIENDQFNDFNALRDLLIRINMYDIIATTSDSIYKSYKPKLIQKFNLKVTKIDERGLQSGSVNKKLFLEQQLQQLKMEFDDLKEKITKKYESELSEYQKKCSNLKNSLKDILKDNESAVC